MQEQYQNPESEPLSDGIRYTWNTIPLGEEASKRYLCVPISTFYTPLYNPEHGIPCVTYTPLLCKKCNGYLNPYAPLDYTRKVWKCVLCHHDNMLPNHYHTLNSNNLPTECQQHSITMDYCITSQQQQQQHDVSSTATTTPGEESPTLLFLIDTAINQSELTALQQQLLKMIQYLPSDTTISVITYGRNVEIYDLSGNGTINRSMALNGLSNDETLIYNDIISICNTIDINNLIVPLSQCELTLNTVLHNLEIDPWIYDLTYTRTDRATGVALYAAKVLATQYALYKQKNNVNMLRQQHQHHSPYSFKNTYINPCRPRVMLFTGGVCTVGLGAVANTSTDEPIRTHNDIIPGTKKGNPQSLARYIDAKKWYMSLAQSSLVIPSPLLKGYDTTSGSNATNTSGTGTSTTSGGVSGAASTVASGFSRLLGTSASRNSSIKKIVTSTESSDSLGIPYFMPEYTPYPQGASIIYDIFACCLDQVGLDEMSILSSSTGGVFVMDDTFSHGVFKGSLQSLLAPIKDDLLPPPPQIYDDRSGQQQQPVQQQQQIQRNILNMSFNAMVTIQPSQHLQLAYNLTHATPLIGYNNVSQPGASTLSDNDYNIPLVSSTTLYVGGLSSTNTICSVFIPLSKFTPNITQYDNTYGKYIYIQYSTIYQDSLGRQIVRVTTSRRPYIVVPQTDPKASSGTISAMNNVQHTRQLLISSFDIDACCVYLSRLCLFKLIHYISNYNDIVKFLQLILCRIGIYYGIFPELTGGSGHHHNISSNPGNANTTTGGTKRNTEVTYFNLPQTLVQFPELIFHLVRSQLIDIFGTSVDESIFFRCIAYNETVSNTLLIIRPRLISFNINESPTDVSLDVSAIQSQRILLMDTYFHLVLWYGQTIEQWRVNKLYEKDEYTYLKQLYDAPTYILRSIISTRFPTPRYIQCVEKGSQERFLLAKLNPSINQETVGYKGNDISNTNNKNANNNSMMINNPEFDMIQQHVPTHNMDGSGSSNPDTPPIFSEDTTYAQYSNRFKASVLVLKRNEK